MTSRSTRSSTSGREPLSTSLLSFAPTLFPASFTTSDLSRCPAPIEPTPPQTDRTECHAATCGPTPRRCAVRAIRRPLHSGRSHIRRHQEMPLVPGSRCPYRARDACSAWSPHRTECCSKAPVPLRARNTKCRRRTPQEPGVGRANQVFSDVSRRRSFSRRLTHGRRCRR
jgi:hypothetical protein